MTSGTVDFGAALATVSVIWVSLVVSACPLGSCFVTTPGVRSETSSVLVMFWKPLLLSSCSAASKGMPCTSGTVTLTAPEHIVTLTVVPLSTFSSAAGSCSVIWPFLALSHCLLPCLATLKELFSP